jgi:hypothetical protein
MSMASSWAAIATADGPSGEPFFTRAKWAIPAFFFFWLLLDVIVNWDPRDLPQRMADVNLCSRINFHHVK